MQSSTGPGRPRIRVSREKMQTRGWQSRLFEASNWPQHYAEKRRKLQYAQLSAFPHTLGHQETLNMRKNTSFIRPQFTALPTFSAIT